MDVTRITTEIRDQRRSVGFDSYDITVKQITDMVAEQQLNIAPEYQRHFVWNAERQSQLVESIFLGIPIPSLFMATNEDSTWEVIDGLQRLTTLLKFINPAISPDDDGTIRPLQLKGLEKVASLNGITFDDLPSNLQLNFLTRPLRVTVLNDRSDFQVRFDLFERLNTGGIVLHEQEIRNCVFQGPFNDFIKQCAGDQRFDMLIRRSDKSGRGNMEELVLKFFAYFEARGSFVHSVKDFLNGYMESKTRHFTNRNELGALFDSTLHVLSSMLPGGIVRQNRPNSTPLVLFEAVAVGVADVIFHQGSIDPQALQDVLDDPELKVLTTGATNSSSKLLRRIDYVSQRVSV